MENREEILLRAWQKLQGSRPIAVYYPVIHITGSLKLAVFLSQLVYWSKHGVNVVQNNGWVYKKTRELTDETGLTERQQDTIKTNLIKQELLEVKRARIGMNSCLAFKVNLQKLGQKVAEFLQADLNGSVLDLNSLRNNTIIHRRLFGKRIAFHRDLVYLTGDINSALMLSFTFRQIVEKYSYNKTKCISITISDWQRIAGLSYCEQHNARKRLIKLGILTEKNLTASRRLYLFLDGALLLNFFSKKLPQILDKSQNGPPSLKVNRFTEFHPIESRISQNEENQAIKANKDTRFSDSTKLEIRQAQNFKLDGYKNLNMYGAKLEVLNRDYNYSDYRYSYYTLPAHAFSKRIQHEPGHNRLAGAGTTGLPQQTNSAHTENNNLVSPTPDNETGLYWPKQFRISERKTAIRMLSNLLLDQSIEIKQLLLDEIAGKDNVRTPVGLLRKLIMDQNQGAFYPAAAHRVQDGRLMQATIKKREAEAEKHIAETGPLNHNHYETGASSRETALNRIAEMKKKFPALFKSLEEK